MLCRRSRHVAPLLLLVCLVTLVHLLLVGVPAKNIERLFPLMLYINVPDLFSFKSCNFKVTFVYLYAC
jgi:hypothetical protein